MSAKRVDTKSVPELHGTEIVEDNNKPNAADMNKYLRRALSFIIIAVVGSFVILFCFIAFHRYPTDDEIIENFTASPSVHRVTIDSTQGDIGYFGITTQGAEGSQTFFLETVPQWVFPWNSYDWNSPEFRPSN